NVVLDPGTAHCDLVVCDNGKSVCTCCREGIPDLDQRSKHWHCVLGRYSFSSGRYYWEVNVERGLGRWAVGVSRADVRKDVDIDQNVKPEEGIWAVGTQAWLLEAYTSPDCTPLPEIRTSSQIRVCLDYEEGQVAFFSVDKGIPIFMFPLALSERENVHP
ncbi:BT1A1 protein, partial [Grantiella picta]|nr:BT1A1 protein [Grantiella picta]